MNRIHFGARAALALMATLPVASPNTDLTPDVPDRKSRKTRRILSPGPSNLENLHNVVRMSAKLHRSRNTHRGKRR